MPNKQQIPISQISHKDVERFASSLKKTEGGCWEWQRSRSPKGYGRFFFNGKIVRAHRFAYAANYGKDPLGAIVCHACDNPSCVNPAHLWCGSYKQNTADMIAKGRYHFCKNPGQSTPQFCAKCGHERVDDYCDVNGARRCRNCVKIRDARKYLKR